MKLPLRERKKVRTAQAIEKAASELFDAQGFDATTLEQIAEVADIHKQTVLRYFKTKEDIAFAHRNRLFDDFVRGLEGRQGGVLDYWRGYIEETSKYASKTNALRKWLDFIGPDDRLYAYQLRLNQRYQDVLADALAVEAGTDPDSDVFAHAIAAMLVGGNADVARMTIRGGRDKDVAHNVVQVIDLAQTLRRETIPPAKPAKAARRPRPTAK
ncbi:TetR/AcrR family transcriptional regulator [Phenylobacterium sp.]|uniref:TetR/AcrR family transcriptional regulator n=1 Tax=Phenylobacterium sp. TaxID=1871053 RepID=UPI0025CFFF05|nr:TetR/AcrR family transcriptional regulator [Phenylobacterium sp.]MBX3484119.1 TetR/AcrR family transcriptional regulator [Phenylobacterium sp.]MCW5758482.1 TetR/AcrR family transcriptional regulator [Phenylobacterium sp.]